MKKLITAIAFTLASVGAMAGTNEYHCKIQHVYEQKDNGEMTLNKKSLYLNERFSINRNTGDMVGLFQSYPTKRVLDRGDTTDWSFKAVFIGGDVREKGHRWAGYLTIKEYIRSVDKPFIISDGQTIYSGLCQ